jgi:hypothetical protein
VCVVRAWSKARRGSDRRVDDSPFVWGEGSRPAVSHSCPIFTSSRDFDFRDGKMGLTAKELRPIPLAGRSVADLEPLMGRAASDAQRLSNGYG